MIQRLYAIYDVKAEAPVGVIQWFSTDAQAVRMFSSVVSSPGTLLSEHPGDFVLLFLGTLNLSTMVIELNLSSRMLPVSDGVSVVRALTRARSDVPEVPLAAL